MILRKEFARIECYSPATRLEEPEFMGTRAELGQASAIDFPYRYLPFRRARRARD
jgi:hypothetical protein